MIAKPPVKPSDMDAILRDKMAEMEALIDAIAEGEKDGDLKLAALVEGEPEAVRIAIIEKLRDMVRARAAEKEQELDKHLEAAKRVEVTRQRNMFTQWLAWVMSEETLRKIRVAFLSQVGLEGHVKNIGHDLANFGVQVQLADKRDVGGLANNAPNLQQGQGKGADKGR